ncbi:MAG: integrin, partial [Myxococcales bacterium]|nr:integrin [Myxococcales bacterium]
SPGPAAEADDSASGAGAVYVFVRDGMGPWSQQAYVKASNTDTLDELGNSVTLSGDGSTLAVGASFEDGNATGIAGNQADDSAASAGAVYLY